MFSEDSFMSFVMLNYSEIMWMVVCADSNSTVASRGRENQIKIISAVFVFAVSKYVERGFVVNCSYKGPWTT